jgi:hypothetical protein
MDSPISHLWRIQGAGGMGTKATHGEIKCKMRQSMMMMMSVDIVSRRSSSSYTP